jgi:hypothetical protein
MAASTFGPLSEKRKCDAATADGSSRLASDSQLEIGRARRRYVMADFSGTTSELSCGLVRQAIYLI